MLSRFRFYWVVGVCGAVLMALEILSSRVLAPHFGNSVYVWGSIISVFLAALSVGYLWGGRLADRHPSMTALGRLIALAGSFQALLLWVGRPMAAWLGGATGATPAGTLLATAVLFGPASILLATVSPYAVRLAIHDLGTVGNTAGRLYALSTLGSLAGTLGCTFGLIPFLELHQIIGLLALLTAVTALLALSGALGTEKAASALAALLLIASVPAVFSKLRLEGDIIYERVTPYQTLVVHQRNGVRTLESDRIRQAAVSLADGEPALPYPRWSALALVLNPRLDRMLVLGLGGGSAPGYLQRRLPHLRVDSVDVDPAVPEVARRFLRFAPRPGDRVLISDARSFLHGSNERWDLIFCDTYIGLSVPFHLTTVQFLDEVERHLTPDGVFMLNLAAGLSDPFSQAMYNTVRDRFQTVYLFRVRGAANVEVLATGQPALPPSQLAARARDLDARFHFDPPLRELVATRLHGEFVSRDTPLLSDEYAPVDRLIRLGQR
ncbi:MAG TPA: fused MFS/spermidine synthase [Thermoanaerobaculia bacterium]|nr:fused MFS/spermidine synthase [Thermoanaerobaculia bacterium]